MKGLLVEQAKSCYLLSTHTEEGATRSSHGDLGIRDWAPFCTITEEKQPTNYIRSSCAAVSCLQ